MGNLNKIVYLTEAQLATLIHDGSITVGGKTVTYNANDIYMTPGTASLPRDISELTALPQAPASSDLLAIRSGSDTYKVDVGDVVGKVYSTQETLTHDTWIDGKPIYRKVLTGTTPNSAASTDWVTLDSIQNVDTIIGMNGVINNMYIVPTSISGSEVAIAFVQGDIRLRYQSINSFKNMPIIVIVEYTKTTDTVP